MTNSYHWSLILAMVTQNIPLLNCNHVEKLFTVSQILMCFECSNDGDNNHSPHSMKTCITKSRILYFSYDTFTEAQLRKNCEARKYKGRYLLDFSNCWSLTIKIYHPFIAPIAYIISELASFSCVNRRNDQSEHNLTIVSRKTVSLSFKL